MDHVGEMKLPVASHGVSCKEFHEEAMRVRSTHYTMNSNL